MTFMRLQSPRKIARPVPASPLVTTTFTDDVPIGPFINANPYLIVGERFEIGLNVDVTTPGTVRLTSSDTAVITIPDAVEVSPDRSTVMFEIVAHAVGRATISATLGDATVTTRATVREDTTEIESLVGDPAYRPLGQFVYELGRSDGRMVINMTGPVVDERIATIASSTPEVASVPDHVVIPGNSNWPQSFELSLRAVGTTWITVTSRGVTLEALIEVIPPVLWIASIEVSHARVRAGDEIDVTVTMSDDTVRDTAITIEHNDDLEMPTGLLIPRGQRAGTFRLRVGEGFDGRHPLAIRWLNSLHLVGLHT